MSIVIGIDENGKLFSKSELDNYDKDAELSAYEEQAISIIKTSFENEHLPFELIAFRRRSENYLTLLLPNNNDFCRIKAGSRSTWISLDMLHSDELLRKDIRFSDVKNRRQRHWKINLSSIQEFEKVTDLIIAVYKSILPSE